MYSNKDCKPLACDMIFENFTKFYKTLQNFTKKLKQIYWGEVQLVSPPAYIHTRIWKKRAILRE